MLQVFAIDNVQERLDIAKEFGAVPVNGKNREEVLATISKGTEGRGVDSALEAVGAQPTIKLAFDLIRMGGMLPAIPLFSCFTPVNPHTPMNPRPASGWWTAPWEPKSPSSLPLTLSAWEACCLLFLFYLLHPPAHPCTPS